MLFGHETIIEQSSRVMIRIFREMSPTCVFVRWIFFRQRTGKADGVEIVLNKRIPSQAGLGGGSSNAASVLRGLRRLYPGGRFTPGMDDIFCGAGGRCSFFSCWRYRVGYRVRGDEVVPLPDLDSRWVLVVSPEVPISTSWAYGQLKLVLTLDGVNTKISPLVSGPDYRRSVSGRGARTILRLRFFPNILN